MPLTTLKVSCKDLEYLFKCVILTANVVGFEVEVSPDSYKVSLKCGLYSTSFLLRTGEMNYSVKEDAISELSEEEFTGDAIVKIFKTEKDDEYIIEYLRGTVIDCFHFLSLTINFRDHIGPS